MVRWERQWEQGVPDMTQLCEYPDTRNYNGKIRENETPAWQGPI